MKWQLIIFHRNQLIAISIALTVMYAAILWYFNDFEYLDKLLTLLIYNDPVLIGLMFGGMAVILEKDQRMISALLVTPMNLHLYLWSRIAVLTLIAWLAGLAMVAAALGTAVNFIHFSFGVILATLTFSFMGYVIVSYRAEFLHFMMRCVPVLIGMSLPMLNFFGLTDWAWLRVLPAQGSLDILRLAYGYESSFGAVAAYAMAIAWLPPLYWLAYTRFKSAINEL